MISSIMVIYVVLITFRTQFQLGQHQLMKLQKRNLFIYERFLQIQSMQDANHSTEFVVCSEFDLDSNLFQIRMFSKWLLTHTANMQHVIAYANTIK